MPYIASGWLFLILQAAVIVHLAACYIFYRIYLEAIEDFLSDIELIKKHRDFYGDSHLGRKMREILITLMIMTPCMYKKQEVIEPWKIKKVPQSLRFWIKFHWYSSFVICASMISLYYFRLRLEVR